MASPLLENLNPEQLEAVTLPRPSALILAGAGSGKTRVLTTRIAWLISTGQARPASILAVTFTNKAAKEMLGRMSAHAADQSARDVGRHLPRSVQPHAARALSRGGSAAALPDPRHPGPAGGHQAALSWNVDDERYPPRQVQWFINSAKEEGKRARDIDPYDVFTRRTAEIFAAYDEQCNREGVVDFAELLLRCFELLAGSDACASHYHRRFTHLLVDEFQDTNVLQYKWLRMLSGPHTAVFAVGDDDQSIYAFRGANVANMQHFERDFHVGAAVK